MPPAHCKRKHRDYLIISADPDSIPTSQPPLLGRLALGVSYKGTQYLGWQSQPNGQTVQDHLEKALSVFACQPVSTLCAGRTDAGVHALQQVVHLDPPVLREANSWVRGTNSYLPADIAVQWCVPVDNHFHARNSARGRRYTYVLLVSPVRPALEHGTVGWIFRPLNHKAMEDAAAYLLGEHDFSSFRSSQCQAPSPIKQLREIKITQHGAYWRFDFEGSAFLHHMIRNIMGCLIAVGTGTRQPSWMNEVLLAKRREMAAPTFSPDGLYFVGPTYDIAFGIPSEVPAMSWLPGWKE